MAPGAGNSRLRVAPFHSNQPVVAYIALLLFSPRAERIVGPLAPPHVASGPERNRFCVLFPAADHSRERRWMMNERQRLSNNGAREVSREELAKVPTPAATDTWFPVSHEKCVDTLHRTLREFGFRIRAMRF